MVTYVPNYRQSRSVVQVRVFFKGKVIKTESLGIKIEPLQWDEDKLRVVRHPNADLLNKKISRTLAEMEQKVVTAELLGTRLTPDSISRLLDGKGPSTEFNAYCIKWIKKKYDNEGTRRTAISDLKKVHTYSPTLQFADIDNVWLLGYQNHLSRTLKQEGNTVWKSMKFIRTMLYDAQANKIYPEENPFEKGTYKMPKYTDPEKDGLYISELDTLEAYLKGSVPVLHKIMGYRFLFMCYTGLRISDAKRFQADEHIANGERVIITSVKSKTKTNLKLFKRLEKILDILKGLPQRTIADQGFNDWLKVILGCAELNRLPVSSHLGRHTFGCLCAEVGLSEEETMKLMGIKNKSVVRVYYDLRQPQIDRAAAKLNNF